jgi:hypothetical protein
MGTMGTIMKEGLILPIEIHVDTFRSSGVSPDACGKTPQSSGISPHDCGKAPAHIQGFATHFRRFAGRFRGYAGRSIDILFFIHVHLWIIFLVS